MQNAETILDLVRDHGKRGRPLVLIDHVPPPSYRKGTELLKRLLADECELCGSTQNCQVHHVRKLADLKRPGRKEIAPWMRHMAARKRKTLVVCQACHAAIHAGRPTGRQDSESITGELGAGKTRTPSSAGG